MDISRESVTILCKGPMGLSEAEEILDRISNSMNASTKINVDCGDISDVSVCFIQLLLSARKSAERKGVEFRVKHPISASLRDALERGGFIGTAGSVRRADDFWLGGP